MDILERIIESLTSDEVRRFKILSNRFKADEKKKLLVLFDAIRSGDFEETEEDVITQFYGSTESKAKNSYYRLRNKLLSNLEKSLLFYHFNYKNSIESYSNIQLYILMRERGLYKEAYHNLKKAERVAIDYDQFTLLEVIYDEMVMMAAQYEVDIEAVILKRRENQKKLDLIRGNREILGMVTQQLMKRNYSRSKRSETVIETLEEVKRQLEEHKDIFQSTSGKMLILKTVVSILIQKSAYDELGEYVKRTYEEFEQNGRFNKENHHTRLMLRIWRINSLQKLLQLEEAGKEIERLYTDLQMYDKQNFNELSFHYYAPKVYNLKLMGELDEAGEVLKEALRHKEILQNELHELYMLISLSDQYFSQKLHSKAADMIRRIKAHAGVGYLDEELRFYVAIFEIVNLFEARAYEEAQKLNKALRKRYKTFLKDDFYTKAQKFLELVVRLITAEIEGKKVFLKAAYKNFVETYPKSEIGENHIILYEVYLQSKLSEEKSYYELLCEEVKTKLPITNE